MSCGPQPPGLVQLFERFVAAVERAVVRFERGGRCPHEHYHWIREAEEKRWRFRCYDCETDVLSPDDASAKVMDSMASSLPRGSQ